MPLKFKDLGIEPEDLYINAPKYSLDGELQIKGAVKDTFIESSETVKKYSESLNPDSPGIYQFAVEVSLLKGIIPHE